MRDAFACDIGDYAKFGLLRKIAGSGFKLAINWHRIAGGTVGHSNDGKFRDYLDRPEKFAAFDQKLFKRLRDIPQQERTIASLEQLLASLKVTKTFFREAIDEAPRPEWHGRALKASACADFVFLDPDNGLATRRMHENRRNSKRHALWPEIRDYYARGQGVILFQHRPRGITSDQFKAGLAFFNKSYLRADLMACLDFTAWQNRYLAIFCHSKQRIALNAALNAEEAWGCMR